MSKRQMTLDLERGNTAGKKKWKKNAHVYTATKQTTKGKLVQLCNPGPQSKSAQEVAAKVSSGNIP